jgi:hypothetical protein
MELLGRNGRLDVDNATGFTGRKDAGRTEGQHNQWQYESGFLEHYVSTCCRINLVESPISSGLPDVIKSHPIFQDLR